MLKNNFSAAFFLISSFIISLANAQEPAKEDVTNPAGANYKLTVDQVDSSRFFNIAVVQALNKTTAKTSILEMKISEKVKFGQITIIAHKCWQSSLDQKPESKILLEVFEDQIGNVEKPQKRIFYGWMFASSPSISGLENPIYDITAISCKNK